MRSLNIKQKIIVLTMAVGTILSLMLAFYSPAQAKKLGNEILTKDAQFIADLLAENLAVGMQMAFIDDGESVANTIALLKEDAEQDAAILNTRVYDDQGKLFKALHESNSPNQSAKKVTQLTFEDLDEYLLVWSPLKDSNKNILGYLEMHFSKAFLAKQASRNMIYSLLIAVFTLLLSVFAAFFLGSNVSNSISRVGRILEDIAQGEGDLTTRMEVNSKDEIGDLSIWFNTFVEKLHSTVTSIAQSTRQVATASNEISASSEEMAAGAEEQQAQLSEVATSIEEMSAMILETSSNAESTQDGAGEANQAAVRGRTKVDDTISGIEGIAAIVQNTSTQIAALKSRSNDIGEVIQVIDDIADQTNLLALNANIEAARAGDAGRGFAVVADEVRKLAERTVSATGDIGDQIKTIQNDVAAAVDAMQKISDQSDDGQKLAGESGNALSKISETIESVNSSITQIASAAVQQSAGVEEISKNIEGVSSVSKQSASTAQQLAASAEHLHSEVQTLEKQLGQFKI